MSDLQTAISIAVSAHSDQTDKGGNPYILHPLRVMQSLRTMDEMIVGVLHDVVEDCSEAGYTFEYLKKKGFPTSVIDALKSVTKTPNEESALKAASGDERTEIYLQFVSRALSNPIGKRVKRADIFDNLNVQRIGQLTEKDLMRLNQYKCAICLIDASE